MRLDLRRVIAGAERNEYVLRCSTFSPRRGARARVCALRMPLHAQAAQTHARSIFTSSHCSPLAGHKLTEARAETPSRGAVMKRVLH